MKTFIRALALAAGTAGYAVCAQAGAILGFDEANLVAAPTTLGSFYSNSAGISIANGALNDQVPGVPGGSGHFLGNIGNDSVDLTVTGKDYNLLSFRFLVQQVPIHITVTDSDGSSGGFDIFPTLGAFEWGSAKLDLSGLGKIASVQFSATGVQFGLDNINFDLSGTSNNVPEPASLALVGLALAGVAASRHRAKA